MKTDNKAFGGALALVSLACVYGFVGYLARELAPGLTLLQQLYIRLILALPFLYLTFHKKINISKCTEVVKQQPLLVLIRSLSLFVLSVPLYFYATQHSTLGNAAFLQILPHTFILGVLINKERLTKEKVGLMLLSLFGAYLIAVKSGLDFGHLGKGELASLMSGLLFSLGFVLMKKHKTKANEYEISFSLMFVSTVMVIVLSLLLGEGLPHPTTVDARFWILLLIAGYINSFMILLANYGFKYVKDTLAGNIMSLEGVFGVMFGYLIYREVPSARESLGASLILASAIASTYLVKENRA